MILAAFALHDTKTGIWHTPWFAPHVQTAIRQVQQLGADTTTFVGRHPADYTLFFVGRYDDQTGMLLAEAPMQNLGTVAGFMAQNAQQQSDLKL